MHHHYRAGCVTQHPLRDRAQHPALHRREPPPSQDNQVGVVFFGEADEHLGRVACLPVQSELHPLFLGGLPCPAEGLR